MFYTIEPTKAFDGRLSKQIFSHTFPASAMAVAGRIFQWIAILLLCAVKVHATGKNDTTIRIKAIAGLQYDITSFRVAPGQKVKLIFYNADDMNHNLVFTVPGAREKVVDAATALASEGLKMNYIPPIKDVLWSIPIIESGNSASITFTVPQKAGVYPYVCTYPGHGYVMFGEMVVAQKKRSATIPNVTPSTKKQGKSVDNLHEHSPEHKHSEGFEFTPAVYRIFMPDAGPAAIAVHLPQRLSYCWDAGTCTLRYAWEGDFLDNTEIWKGHRDAQSRILGSIFFRETSEFPLQPDKPGNIPVVQFRGYRLIDHLPEFHYVVDGMDVYEFIEAKKDGSGLIRNLRVPAANRILYFVTASDGRITYEASAGTWQDGQLRILPEEAKHITITMTKSS